ncbi:AAA family ATPase [Ruminococcus champanellensis]|uniref:AAA family ATPase n=1 Tax=Ruminococcus champanellensis TaxID=1161942 RepID=UPI0026DA7C2E|nr:AAA family ATPase [Ruminococcus champanellensis]
MYTEEQEALLVKCRELADKVGGQNKAAELLGVNAGALSQLLAHTYAANPARQFEKIAAYFAVKDETAQSWKTVDYVDTYISTAAYDVLRLCQARGGISIICGDAGIGKTKAVEKYVKDHPTNAFMVTVNECFARSKPLLGLIADTIGAPHEKSMDGLWRSIVGKLSDGMILIVDESQNLSMKTVDMLRSFSDYFEARGQTVGICLVGNAETAGKFGSRASALAQVKNRTKYTATFVSAKIQYSDIVKLFPNYRPGTDDMAIDFLLRIARTDQGIRGCVNLVSSAHGNEDTSYEGLVETAKKGGFLI